jgi:hypothetical protein
MEVVMMEVRGEKEREKKSPNRWAEKAPTEPNRVT